MTPHVLRHTCAMRLLAVGVDTSVIALWLGHEGVETTQIYLHADLAIKERALARTAPSRHDTRSLPATRHAPRLPREPLIMPSFNSTKPLPHKASLSAAMRSCP